MYEQLIQQIEAHASYGPAVRNAASNRARLVLNYHTHGPASAYCVSICTRPSNVLPVLGQLLPLEELAHVKGIGQAEDQCLPRMQPLARELTEHYGLDAAPEIYLNGKPVSPASGPAGGS